MPRYTASRNSVSNRPDIPSHHVFVNTTFAAHALPVRSSMERGKHGIVLYAFAETAALRYG